MRFATTAGGVAILMRNGMRAAFRALEALVLLYWLAPMNCAHADAATSVAPLLPDVTVIAPRPPTAQELAGEAVYQFVRVHAKPALVTGQLARWTSDVCPMIQGLSAAFNDFVSTRILVIARDVGAPHQDEQKCKTRHNVYVFFTSDPKGLLDQVMKQDTRLLGFHYPHQTEDLERINRPIQGWYLTATRGAWGAESIDESDPLLPPETNRLDVGIRPAGEPGSRLTNRISSGLVNVVIVADVKEVIGHEIGSISDYIAMLTLTQAFAPERCGTLPSILDLMAPNCDREKPLSITAGDLAFLRALYHTDLEAILPLERSGIRDNMVRQFKKAPTSR
jgi:hypothetical protein